MNMRLEIPFWTSHHNMLVYSILYYCEKNKIDFDFYFNPKLPVNGAILVFEENTFFFDYSDDSVFISDPKSYDFYFKRSLMDYCFDNVFPLNFQVNLSYKPLKLLSKIKIKDLISYKNRIEIIRCLDIFDLFTNLSHNAMDIRLVNTNIHDNQGNIIFNTRLWNPSNTLDDLEKERRFLQNKFRIESIRLIKKNFNNVSVGLFPDKLSLKEAPDLVMNLNEISKLSYFRKLNKADIGVADDGLKDTPGWKIGEYLMFGKAVVTTPVNTKIESFEENVNYKKLASRNAFEELPEKIETLLKDKSYLEMRHTNLDWSNTYLHPSNYINRVLSKAKIKK